MKLSMGAVGREDQDRMSVLVQQHLSDLLTVYTKERVFSTGPEESEAPSRGQHAQLVFPFAPTSLGKFSILTASWKLSSPSSDTLEFDSALPRRVCRLSAGKRHPSSFRSDAPDTLILLRPEEGSRHFRSRYHLKRTRLLGAIVGSRKGWVEGSRGVRFIGSREGLFG
jgi:hypothetical protein